MDNPSATTRVVFFDGVCNLCNGVVQFILDRDRDKVFSFAPLQSETGMKMLAERSVAIDGKADPDSVILVEGEHVYQRSDAVLHIARHLSFPWNIGYAGLVVPRFLRDALYKLVARHRYRWFGKTETCRVPTPELRARFLA